MKTQRIVVLGGGTAGANFIKSFLIKQPSPLHLTCLVNTTDNGGHSGEIRKRFGIIPPGDLRRLISSTLLGPVRDRYEFRDKKGAVHGNTVLADQILAKGLIPGITAYIEIFPEFPKDRLSIWPISSQASDLCFCLPAPIGIIKGQREIIFQRPRGSFGELSLDPPIELLPEAKSAILMADTIIIAPSGVVGSIAPILLVKGVKESIQNKRLIWFTPLFSLPNDGVTPWEQYRQIIENLAKKPDLIIANSHPLPDDVGRLYQEHGFYQIRPDPTTPNLINHDLLANDSQIPLEPPAVMLTPLPRYFLFVQHDAERIWETLEAIL